MSLGSLNSRENGNLKHSLITLLTIKGTLINTLSRGLPNGHLFKHWKARRGTSHSSSGCCQPDTLSLASLAKALFKMLTWAQGWFLCQFDNLLSQGLIHHIPSWPQICYVAKTLDSSPLIPKCWNYRCVSSVLAGRNISYRKRWWMALQGFLFWFWFCFAIEDLGPGPYACQQALIKD